MLEDIHPSTFNYILNYIHDLANGYTKNVDLLMSQKWLGPWWLQHLLLPISIFIEIFQWE